MTDFSRTFGRGHGGFGRLPQLAEAPSFEALPPASWPGGLDYRMPGQAREGSTDDLLDVILDRRGALRRVRGLVELERLDHTALRVAVHQGLEGKTELLIFAPPYLGVRRGSGVSWYNLGFSQSKPEFAFTNYGGTFIFSNLSNNVWVREPEQAGATLEPRIPPARAYATFAGRVIAGGTLLDGRYEPALLRWSGPTDYLDWDGIGSGFEPLISNTIAGEEFIQFVPMSFDYLALFCRTSIWVGRRTGLLDRPVDFAPRVTGLSTVIPRTIQNTPLGVIYVESSGVYVFDGNTVRSIGDPIEAGAFPIAREAETLYHSAYNPVDREYLLFTPTQTFVFQLETQRWFRRSLIAKSATPVAEYSEALRWIDMTDVWANTAGQWNDLGSSELDYRGLVFLVTSSGEEFLAEEDPDALDNLGIPLRPYAMFPPLAGSHEVESWDIGSVGVEYSGEGTIELAWDSVEEDLARLSQKDLGLRVRPYTHYWGVGATTSSPRARLFFVSGDPRVRRVTQWVQRRGRRV